MQMPMFFEWSFDTIVLFEQLHVQNPAAYFVLCLVLIAICILKQYLVLQQVLLVGSRGKIVLETLLYITHTSIGYGLMLVCMTFNAGLFVTTMIGLAIGHFLFPPVTFENVKGLVDSERKLAALQGCCAH
mmetsp:Transcript_3879/g.4761  ORF Transcript_3879/g.4761 Transcript_3879/m.4761 type:complete len:130 (+) Transcript_3879:104-493(+)